MSGPAASATQREVLIPLMGHGEDGSLGRVAADRGLPPPHPAQLERSLSELLEVGLYVAGQVARSAVRHHLGLAFWHPMVAGVSLYPLNPGDFLGLGEENSESAQLGLALALLLCRSQSPQRSVWATGALQAQPGNREVLVRPVAHVGRKLALLLRHSRRPGAAPPPALALVPLLDTDGAVVTERFAGEIAELSSLGTRVIAVRTLSEASQAVAATDAWTAPWLRIGRAAALLLAIAASLWLGHGRWQQRAIALQFVPVADARGHAWMTPARASLDDPQRLSALCAGTPPALFNGELLALSVAADQGTAMHYALAAVAPSGLKILPLPAARAGQVRSLVPVPGPAEPTLLAVLAWRETPDLVRVEQGLRSQLAAVGAGERIAHARHLLEQAAPGSLLYLFQSWAPDAREGDTCKRL